MKVAALLTPTGDWAAIEAAARVADDGGIDAGERRLGYASLRQVGRRPFTAHARAVRRIDPSGSLPTPSR